MREAKKSQSQIPKYQQPTTTTKTGFFRFEREQRGLFQTQYTATATVTKKTNTRLAVRKGFGTNIIEYLKINDLVLKNEKSIISFIVSDKYQCQLKN